jgi:hypothetical protein
MDEKSPDLTDTLDRYGQPEIPSLQRSIEAEDSSGARK